MFKSMLMLLMATMLTFSSGCGKIDPSTMTIAEKINAANTAGSLAVTGWILAAKPSPELISAVTVVVDKIQSNLSDWQDNGFITNAPGIDEAMYLLLKGDDKAAQRAAAHSLSVTLLSELDSLFVKHPDWQVKGSDAATIVASFCSGASKTLIASK